VICDLLETHDKRLVTQREMCIVALTTRDLLESWQQWLVCISGRK